MNTKNFLKAVTLIGCLPFNVAATDSTQPKILKTDAGRFFQKSDGKQLKIPECIDEKGVKVRFSIRDDRPGMAYSEYTSHYGPSVALDSRLDQFSVPVLLVTFFHECAHHTQGHARIGFMASHQAQSFSVEEYHQFEFEADCSGAKMMLDAGFSLKYIQEAFVEFERVSKASKLHPNARVEQVKQCLTSANQALQSL